MTKVSILYWQEIPSMVEAKDGTVSYKIELSQKFQELIDLIAMKRKLDGSDEYLMHWNKSAHSESDAEPDKAAEKVAADIEAQYETIKADSIANS